MTVNLKFERYKLDRELKRSGESVEFLRSGVNEYGESSDDEQVLGDIRCLYHEQNGYVQLSTGETTQTRSKKIPMMLCLYDSCKELGIKLGDFCFVDGRKYNVTGVTDIQNWNIIADISLELVDAVEVGKDVVQV